MSNLHYLAFFKPFGIPSTFTDPSGRSTLKDFISQAGVYAAGRLDLESEGLLILSDDGNFIHRLTDPLHEFAKTYFVQVEGIPTNNALAKLEKGVVIQGEVTRRCQVMVIGPPILPERAKPITPHGQTGWLRFVLREGKKHQIRHMTAAVGLPTLRLVRVAIGPISLGDLQPGQWRALSRAEINLVLGEPKKKTGTNVSPS
jgi:23S rRNA pseudouridine2457 synthase